MNKTLKARKIDVSEKKMLTIITYLYVFLIANFMTSQSTMVTALASEFSLDKIRTGYFFTANFIGFASFILFGGLIADRIGKKYVLQAASFALAVLLFLFQFSYNYSLILLIFFLSGGLCGIVESIASAYVAELNPIETDKHISITQFFFCFGALTGPFGSGLLIKYNWDWRNIYAIMAVASLALSIFFVIAARNISVIKHASSLNLKEIKSLASNRLLLIFCLCIFLYTGSEAGAWSWMVVFMIERLGFSLVESSLAVGIFWISMLIGRIICTAALRKYEAKTLVIFLAFSSAAATAFSALTTTKFTAWVATVLIGLAYSGTWPLIVAYGSARMQNTSGLVFSLMVGSGGLGSALVPAFMGFVGQNVGITASTLSPVLFFLMLGFIFIGLSRERKETNI